MLPVLAALEPNSPPELPPPLQDNAPKMEPPPLLAAPILPLEPNKDEPLLPLDAPLADIEPKMLPLLAPEDDAPVEAAPKENNPEPDDEDTEEPKIELLLVAEDAAPVEAAPPPLPPKENNPPDDPDILELNMPDAEDACVTPVLAIQTLEVEANMTSRQGSGARYARKTSRRIAPRLGRSRTKLWQWRLAGGSDWR